MLLKERLTEAFTNKENNINNFVWKGKKVKDRNGKITQGSCKMVDMDVNDLKAGLKRCESMLYNQSKDDPGRYVVLEKIKDARQRCNVELFLRWLDKENNINRYSFMNIILTFLQNNSNLKREELTLNDVIGQCPLEFQTLPIDLVLDGCMDYLGIFNNKKHRIITTSFILRQGVWPTSEEKQEFSKNKVRLTSKNILEYLEVNPNHSVRINSKGLSLKQIKSIINLQSKKYSEMSSSQLELLRNRILFALEREVKFHIDQWKLREKQIRMVLASKGIIMN